MLKIIRKKDYELFKKESDSITQHNIYLKGQLEKKDIEIEKLKEKIDRLDVTLEEEKEKYKKYAKQMRVKTNESAKKWLNGYPDE
jgi:chromosome segregation ATPase